MHSERSELDQSFSPGFGFQHEKRASSSAPLRQFLQLSHEKSERTLNFLVMNEWLTSTLEEHPFLIILQ